MGKIPDVNMRSPLTQTNFDFKALKMGNAGVTSGIRRLLIFFPSFSKKFVGFALR